MSSSLDLYAKIEPLLGIEEATIELHHYYLQLLNESKPQRLLDVGCGDGRFLEAAKNQGITCAGIDLSQAMVDKAKEKGLSVARQDIKDAIGAYDVVTAIFDVLNFLDKENLKDFFSHVSRLLNKDGYFYADINTFYGFSEVAEGLLAYDDDIKSLIVDASFKDNELITKMSYFEKEGDLFRKSHDVIKQHFHEISEIAKMTDLELQIEMPIKLYGDEADKAILCFKKLV